MCCTTVKVLLAGQNEPPLGPPPACYIQGLLLTELWRWQPHRLCQLYFPCTHAAALSLITLSWPLINWCVVVKQLLFQLRISRTVPSWVGREMERRWPCFGGIAGYSAACVGLRKAVESLGMVKFTRYRPGVAQSVGRGIALLFHDRSTRRGLVVSSTPRPHFTLGKDPVPILQEAGWAPGPVWTGGKSRPQPGFDSGPSSP